MSHVRNDQELQRLQSLEQLRALGIEPYPSATFAVTHFSTDIHANYKDEEQEQWKQVKLAGRLMSRRIMGKASFAELQDAQGRIQIYLNRDEICPGEDKTLYNDLF